MWKACPSTDEVVDSTGSALMSFVNRSIISTMYRYPFFQVIPIGQELKHIIDRLLVIVSYSFGVLEDHNWLLRTRGLSQHRHKHRQTAGAKKSLFLGYHTFLYLRSLLPTIVCWPSGETFGEWTQVRPFRASHPKLTAWLNKVHRPLQTAHPSAQEGVAMTLNTHR